MASKLMELSKGTREYLQASWPSNPQLGRPDPIAMKLAVLTDEDVQLAVAAAHQRMRDVKLDMSQWTADELETEVSIQVLARACRDNDQPEKAAFAVDADDLRSNTAPWERGEVIDAWRPWQERRNPLRPLTAEEQETVDALVKKKDAATLRACGLDTLVGFMITSASPPST